MALWKIVSTYLWQGRRPQIKWEVLCLPVEEGGLGLLDPVLQVRATKMWWIRAMTMSEEVVWKGLAMEN